MPEEASPPISRVKMAQMVSRVAHNAARLANTKVDVAPPPASPASAHEDQLDVPGRKRRKLQAAAGVWLTVCLCPGTCIHLLALRLGMHVQLMHLNVKPLSENFLSLCCRAEVCK